MLPTFCDKENAHKGHNQPQSEKGSIMLIVNMY